MNYETKTQEQATFNVSSEAAGAIVPVAKEVEAVTFVTAELNAEAISKNAEWAVEDTETIAQEVETFNRKRFWFYEGIKGQAITVAAKRLAATVIAGIGFAAPRVANFQASLEAYDQIVEQHKTSQKSLEEAATRAAYFEALEGPLCEYEGDKICN